MFWKDIPHFDLKKKKNGLSYYICVLYVLCFYIKHIGNIRIWYDNHLNGSLFFLNAFHVNTNSIISASQNLDKF